MKKLCTVISLGLLASCGGGSDSDSGSGTEPEAFQAGIFRPASTFENECATPRTGIDPFTGEAYPDTAGSVLAENNWLRSWSNDLYLWYDEITDQDPALYADPLDYFDILKTDAITSSGNFRDRFHFTRDTEAWQELSQSGVATGYGATFLVVEPVPPREIIVAYVEPGSPAEAAGLMRGTEVLQIDGVDAVNGGTQADVDALNVGLRPSAANQGHDFTLRNYGESTDYTATLVSENITSTPVLSSLVMPTVSGNVGYLLFNDHIATAEQQLIDAIQQFDDADVSDLVLDLRYNGGGYLVIASQLSYMIVGSTATSDRTFETLVFNDKHTVTNPVTNERLEPELFESETVGLSAAAGQTLPTLDLSRVFVLTTESTCSASESIINSLRGINVEVIQIGSTTCGKPYGFYPQDNCGTTYFTIQFSGENDIDFGDYPDGFSPANAISNIGEPVTGCSVADDFSVPLGDPDENMLATALSYRLNSVCPTANATVRQKLYLKAESTPELVKPLWLQNRIMGKNARQ